MTEHLLGPLWSQWTELGLPGVIHAHERVAIDPEALLLYTPWLARREPRLLEGVFSWCTQHADWIVPSRLRSLHRKAPAPVRSAFEAMSAELQDHLSIRWPGLTAEGTGPWPSRELRPLSVDPSRPSLARLRARSLFGPGARADILCEMLARPQHAFSARELTRAGYSKPALHTALGQLASGGLLHSHEASGMRLFSLLHPDLLRELLGAQELDWQDGLWLMETLAAWQELVEQTGQPDIVRRVEAARVRDRLTKRFPERAMPEVDGQAEAWERLVSWLEEQWNILP